MSCQSCKATNSKNPNAPEYNKGYKFQNNRGCGCSGTKESCETPSFAEEGSPLYEWEKVYGKLITNVKFEYVDGKLTQIIEKFACPKKNKRSKSLCCSVKYRIL